MAALDIHAERQRERWYSHLLTYKNIEDALSNPINRHKLTSNWTQVNKTLGRKENIVFLSLKEITIKLIEKCQTRPWYKKLTSEQELEFCRDAQIYIAFHIWDFKRESGNILVDSYWHQANMRHLKVNFRSFSHEAVKHGLKPVKEEVKQLVDLWESGNLERQELVQEVSLILEKAQDKFETRFEEILTEQENRRLAPDYDGDRTRPQIKPSEPFPEDQLDKE